MVLKLCKASDQIHIANINSGFGEMHFHSSRESSKKLLFAKDAFHEVNKKRKQRQRITHLILMPCSGPAFEVKVKLYGVIKALAPTAKLNPVLLTSTTDNLNVCIRSVTTDT